MASLSATVYHANPRDAHDQATKKATALLEDYGYTTKLVNVKLLTAAVRRDLEMSGFGYPIIKINSKYIVRNWTKLLPLEAADSREQLQSELDARAASEPREAPKPLNFMDDNAINFGASPPGPQNIFGGRMDNSSDSSSPRRFGPSDDVSDSPGSELLQPAHRNFQSHASPFGDDIFDNADLEEITDLNEEELPLHSVAIGVHGGAHGAHNPQAQSAPAPEVFAAPSAPSSSYLNQEPSSSVPHSHSAPIPAVSSSPSNGAPGAFKMGPISSSPSKSSQQPQEQHRRKSSSQETLPLSMVPSSSKSVFPQSAVPAFVQPQVPRDQRTERVVWLFSGLKAYCESADFKRQVNLLGKTADFVESQARSVWGLFGFGGSSGNGKNNDGPASGEEDFENNALGDSGELPNGSPQRNGSPDPSSAQNTSVFVPPPDSETTLTLLVVRKNWYGRDQYRFLRFETDSFVRLRTEPPNYGECERTSYASIVAARVSGSNIHFSFMLNNTRSEISYDFGDPQLARSLAEALSFLKGTGTVAVSFVGN